MSDSSPESERSAAQVRGEIEETRRELGETVAAVAEKTDVKKQAQAKADDIKAQASAKADEVKAQASAKAEEAQAVARQNPKPAAIAGAVLALFILWRLLRR
jgi:hypothetical protein